MRKNISIEESFARLKQEKSSLVEENIRVILSSQKRTSNLRRNVILTGSMAAVIFLTIFFCKSFFHYNESIQIVRQRVLIHEKNISFQSPDLILPKNTVVRRKKHQEYNSYNKNYPGDAKKGTTGVFILSLAPDELQKLGIDISDKNICITTMKKCIGATGETPYTGAENTYAPAPLFVTDENGELVNMHDEIKPVSSTNTLVPVLVCTYDTNTRSSITKHDLICWYTPDDTFLTNIPCRYSEDMRNDYIQISGKSANNTSCEYFEASKNTLASFSEMKLYPNPVQKGFTLEVKLKSEKRVHMGIYTINGNEVMALATDYRMSEGTNTLHFDVDCLARGIYLLEIISENGETAYERIIKQ